MLHETYDHWSVAVLTVTVHSSFFILIKFSGHPRVIFVNASQIIIKILSDLHPKVYH